MSEPVPLNRNFRNTLEPMDEKQVQHFSDLYSSLEGAEAIYLDRPSVLHVRVHDISFDSAGIKALMTDLLSPGMGRVSNNPCPIRVVWGLFEHSSTEWRFSYPGTWSLYFAPTVIGALVGIVAKEDSCQDPMITYKKCRAWLTDYRLKRIEVWRKKSLSPAP